jgi:hypothetical protein
VLIPLVTSAVLARQDAQVFEGLEAIGTPHMQQRTFTMVPIAEGWMGSSMIKFQ